jgi:thioredoxin-like negative regulator of GroEL
MSTNIAFQTGKVVIYFTASWCGPCQRIKPVWENLEAQYKTQGIKFYKIDVDDPYMQDIKSIFEYKSIPAFFFLKDAAQVEGWTGANPERLEKSIKNLASL